MRNGTTKNARKVTIVEIKTFDAPLQATPAAPFGALVISSGAISAKLKKPDFAGAKKLATHFLQCGCAWVTLHAGKQSEKLHAAFDEAIVDYQMDGHTGAECGASGEAEDDLDEASRDAVYWAKPTYGEMFKELLVVVVGEDAATWADKAQGIVQGVEDL